MTATQGLLTRITNTENATSTSNNELRQVVGGTSGGDPFHRFNVSGAADWSLGIRNSDSQNFYLTAASDLSTSVILKVTSAGKFTFPATNTAAGTTGNQTINKTSGTVNIAAAGTTVTVTNSLCTTSSLVFAVIRTNDTTAIIKNVVPGSGSFIITLNAAATAEVSIGWWIIN